MSVLSKPMCFVVFPLSFIHITIRMDESSAPVGFVIAPVAFINRAVRPNLLATAILRVVFHIPLPFVFGSIFKQLLVSELSADVVLERLTLFVVEIALSVSDTLDCWVVVVVLCVVLSHDTRLKSVVFQNLPPGFVATCPSLQLDDELNWNFA